MGTIIEANTLTQRTKLSNALKLGLAQCKACDIHLGYISSIKVNTRAKSRWGLCKKLPKGWEIEISDRLLTEDATQEALMDTFIHELLHTVKGCQNHGPVWKAYAKVLNDKYGYNIKRCTTAEEKGMPKYTHQIQAKYKITCLGCGCENHYMRRTRAVQYIQKKPINSSCYCNLCGSHSFKVEVL